MIGKVVVGTNFDKLLRYIESKDGAYRLDSNMAGNDIAQLGAEFKASAALRPGMSRCVWHTTLSVSPDESVRDGSKNESAFVSSTAGNMNRSELIFLQQYHQDKLIGRSLSCC